MAWSIDEIQFVLMAILFPRASRCRGLNGDAALLLFLEEVHGCGAVVHFTNFVNAAGVEKNALGDGGFASVDVRADSEVSDFRKVLTHGCSL